MPETLPTREEAWQLLCEWTQGESLRKHARAVEHAMRACARKYGEDEEKWGVVGMLHDFDYERYPDQRHPQLGSEVLRVVAIRKKSFAPSFPMPITPASRAKP